MKISKKYLFLLYIALAIIVYVAIYPIFFVGIFSGPSFISEIKNDRILSEDIKEINFLRFKLSDNWPFKKRDYNQKERKSITDRADINELYSILKYNSQKGTKHDNHPIKKYSGILEIITNKEEVYYILYSLYTGHGGGQYVEIESNTSNETNPNAAEAYWNVPLNSYLKVHDPWYGEE